MTDMQLELELNKLRWRADIFEIVFVRTAAGVLASSLGVTLAGLSEVLVMGVDAIRQIVEPSLLENPTLENREEMAAAYREVCEEMKQNFAVLLSAPPQGESQEEKKPLS